MIKVMILDDEEIYLEKETQITEKYFAGKGLPYKIDIYQNADWFLFGLKGEAYNALLPAIIEKEEHYYIIEKKGEVEKLAYSDIMYLKKEGKYVVFVHRRGESKVRKSLKLVQQELNSEEFLLVDKAYIANIKHIIKLKSHDLYMRDGMILPVGNARFNQVKQAILEFWR